MGRQQLDSANQARKALDDRLKTTTQTLLARIEAFEALKEKFAESEATRRKLRKIARTQREKLESSHREIVLFRHHQTWREVSCVCGGVCGWGCGCGCGRGDGRRDRGGRGGGDARRDRGGRGDFAAHTMPTHTTP